MFYYVLLILQICYHHGDETHPDLRDSSGSGNGTKLISDFIGKHFKGVATRPSIVEPCMYTVRVCNMGLGTRL